NEEEAVKKPEPDEDKDHAEGNKKERKSMEREVLRKQSDAGMDSLQQSTEKQEQKEKKGIKRFILVSIVPLAIIVLVIVAKNSGLFDTKNYDSLQGSNICFGNYWQSDTNNDGLANKDDDMEPIEWKVLSVEGNDAFLLSNKVLDVNKYNERVVKTTWENCSLRKWLNEDFFLSAFDEKERNAILSAAVKNEDESETGTEGGNDTNDKIYLLSVNESSDEMVDIIAPDTSYTERVGSMMAESSQTWWLRSPGHTSYEAVFVSGEGEYYSMDTYEYMGIRPVLHLNLSKSVWTKVQK
ncbi:MAG: hypothetical protein IJ733_20370, partial [Lachnospiraceae bacterium]|nr:hypothetical protein [Lachnospiraceae bacterium]